MTAGALVLVMVVVFVVVVMMEVVVWKVVVASYLLESFRITCPQILRLQFHHYMVQSFTTAKTAAA